MGTRFQWSQVDGRVARRILTQCEPETFAKAKVTRMSDHEVQTAAQRLGEPPRLEYTDELVDVALSVWLPLASAETVEALATYIQESISGPARTRELRTKPERIDFIRARNRTKLLKLNVRQHFLRAHKVADGQPRKPNRPKDERALPTPVRLIGRSQPARALHRHQREALEGLDRLVLDGRRLAGGVLVLPTGAGKTEAMASWLLDRMATNPGLRVLWIAGQQELLRQAASRFETLAASKPRGFERLGREIHGNGYPTSLLAGHDTDIAFVTIQSLSNDLVKGPKSSLRQFLRRENMVVIDEAHHAAAPSYTKFFEELGAADTTIAVIGLTATPFPTSLDSRVRFRGRFPNEVHRVTAEQLMVEKILARPVLHVVQTHERIALDPKELDLAEANDLPPSVLKRLDSDARNRSIVDTYLKNGHSWGKTLMFATTIEHADHLHKLLVEAGVAASVMHSRMELDRTEVLDGFRKAAGPAVLVSVGMLTEGVDVPDARTAFLGRPTASRILLQQMIGRVLRGPHAGGEAEANIVYFSDVWSNFSEILEPPEALSGISFEYPASGPTSRRAWKIDSNFCTTCFPARAMTQSSGN